MARHENDLDFMLPLMLFGCDPIVFIWGKIDKTNFRIKLLRKNNIDPVFLLENRRPFWVRFFIRILRELRCTDLVEKIVHKLDKKETENLLRSLESALGSYDSKKVNTVIFDYATNKKVGLMIDVLKKWGNDTINIMALPHGMCPSTNKLRLINKIEPEKPLNWPGFDKLICHSTREFAFLDSNGVAKAVTLPTLRYTAEWVGTLIDETNSSNKLTLPESNGHKRKNILFIHTKSKGKNIYNDEVFRCIRIVEQFDCFNILIKIHPRGYDEAKLFSDYSKNIILTKKHMVQCARWADYVVFFQSSAVFDAFVLNKPVIYPSYATSNIMDEAILKHCNIARTPEDFYYLVVDILNENNLEPPNYVPEYWKPLLIQWKSLLNKH